MDIANRYSGNTVIVKGRCTATLTSLTDLNAANILTDQATLLNTPSTLAISSSSALDASPSGSGARTLELLGLGEDGTFISETIALNGQTVVTTVNKYYRLYWARVKTCGTAITGYNAGDIYIIKSGTGGSYSGGIPGTFTIASAIIKIAAQTNQGGSCLYTTPNISGFWRVKRIDISATTQPGIAVLQILDNNSGDAYLRDIYINFAAYADVSIDMTPYNLVYTKQTDIRLLANTAAINGAVNGAIYIEYSAI